MFKKSFTFLFLSSAMAFGHGPVQSYSSKTILSDQAFLDALHIPIQYRHDETGLGVAVITPEMEEAISHGAHLLHRCAGFEDISNKRASTIVDELNSLAQINAEEAEYMVSPRKKVRVETNADIQSAIQEVNINNLKTWVTWLSSFDTRYNKGRDPNKHVLEMKTKLEDMLKNSTWSYRIDLIDHKSTPQKSIRLHLDGTDLKNEIIVMGAHLDSINQKSIFGNGKAPGADDNASGSSNLVEALRIILGKNPTRRSIEFFWYAGEESGLLGSAEIADTYKNQNANVKAVLQLDMTLFPGNGQFVLGSESDFTAAWLRDYLVDINRAYLNVTIADDTCGYGCSDHASWYRRGFPTLMPFEATLHTMNKNIHSANDVIDQRSDFEHSAVFSRLAIVFALDLGNATIN